MGDTRSPSPSGTPSSSIGTDVSESREPEWWWTWGSHSPTQRPIGEHCESLILTEKRIRKQPKKFPAPDLYSGETEADARKRMRLVASHVPKQQLKTISGLESEISGTSFSHSESLGASSARSDKTAKAKKRKSMPAAPIDTKNEALSEADNNKTAKEIRLLKQEINLLDQHYNRKTSTLEQELRYLQEENFALCEKLDWYKTQHEANASGSCTSDEIEALSAKLERRNMEIEEKIQQNTSLEQQLNTAEGLSAVLRDSHAKINNVSVILSKDLAQLEIAMSQAALLLVQCLSDKKLSNIRKSPELNAMIRSSFGDISILDSHPKLAFSALLFHFTRERVFYSDCWTALQLEGYMLRGYQAVIECVTPRGTLESLHRAALELMLEENNPFRDCWIQSQVEEVQSELLQLLSPLIEASKKENFDKDIRTALNQGFTEAFHFRARCVAPRGTRYDLVQVKAGDIFDPEYMEAQRPDGCIQSVPSKGKVRRVKVCIHGCLVSHESSFDGESCSTISQPFVSVYENDQRVKKKLRGVLKSGKAIVILEDDA